MNKPVRLFALLCIFLALGTSSLSASAPPDAEDASEGLTFSVWNDHPIELPAAEEWAPRVIGIPAHDVDLKRGGHPRPPTLALPNFTSSITVGRTRYPYTLIGSDPSRKGAKNAVIPVVIVPIMAVFDTRTVFDPTVPDLCSQDGVPLTLLQQSPIFQTFNVGDGNRQYEEEFRRLEFWKYIGAPGAINPTYSVKLSPRTLPKVTVNFHGFPTQLGRCGNAGLVDFETWVKLVETTILPAVEKSGGVGPGNVPLLVLSNVFFYDGTRANCCTLGFHSAVASTTSFQTYAVGNFDSTHLFFNSLDVSSMSHELAEWLEDPLVSNPTPPWGHIGQVTGCQDNLEVGDPLSGTVVDIAMPNGFTYHPQELAFFSWFFGQKPSLGFDGWFSSAGTFRTPAAPCH